MTIALVKPSTAIDIIGPYLAAKVICPACALENVLVHIEGRQAP